MGGGWAMNTGTYQTPNMDMRRHIKGHQTQKYGYIKEFQRKTQTHKQTF